MGTMGTCRMRKEDSYVGLPRTGLDCRKDGWSKHCLNPSGLQARERRRIELGLANFALLQFLRKPFFLGQ